jgi:nucleotide-binding universal stress UspA family protein
MFQSIIVPTDGSAFAEAALPLATQIALRAKARIGLLLVTSRRRYHLWRLKARRRRDRWSGA